MAIRVDEIMNKEIYAAKLEDEASSVCRDLVQLGISGAPILDDEGRPLGMVSLKDLVDLDDGTLAVDRMSVPALVTTINAPITSVARLMAETQCHRIVVVDGDRAVGMVSTLDVVRALIGQPAFHPPAFPHYDPGTGVTWTDSHSLDWQHVEAAPAAPGVLLIFSGGAGLPETLIWGESTEDLRGRLLEYLETPMGGPTIVSYWKKKGALRFKAAEVSDPQTRGQVLEDAMT